MHTPFTPDSGGRKPSHFSGDAPARALAGPIAHPLPALPLFRPLERPAFLARPRGWSDPTDHRDNASVYTYIYRRRSKRAMEVT